MAVGLPPGPPAGLDVITEARLTPRQSERVTAAAERHRRGETGVLRVGFEASGAGELTTRARAEFARRHPGVRVAPKRYDWGQEAAALRDGLTDVAFVWLPHDQAGLHAEVVHSEPRVVGLPSGHPLVGRSGVSVLDVRDEPLMWTERAPREWVDGGRSTPGRTGRARTGARPTTM
ncbi:LysR substrate-binding domain-containing protein [Streptomyces sp. NBC_01320]|uniref:LysR substrate-binding domain-containing protein n=1 Tax=Streptomyces sp. NBC_01320 TaxID=2903824 RepID=UPI002E10ED58|nr:LysR substrate-binding domain-containing protein [Streptomyces sp. NBC_01320]